MDNKKIIIALVIVIIILVAAISFLNLNHAKIESKITVKSNSTLHSGDSFSIKLTDINNNPIKGQKVNITIIDSNGTQTSKIKTTSDSGKANYALKKLKAGNYTIKVKYNGTENFSECNATQKIKIIKEVDNSQQQETPSQTNTDTDDSSSNEEYDDGYWETSIDAPFEYHTEHYSDGEIRQFDRDGNLVGSTYEEDQAYLAEKFPRR